MGRKGEAALRKTWKGNDATARARAWQLLVRKDEKQYLKEAIKDKDANIRILPLRYARVENKDPIPLVKQLARDPEPQVRRECALSLYMNQSSEAPELWAELAQQLDPQDRWALEALGIGAFGQDERFFDAWLKKVGENWNTPVGRQIIWRTRSTKAPALIAKIIQDKSTPKEERDRFFRALDFIKGPEKDAALVQLLTQ
jgi:hypothetical protein